MTKTDLYFTDAYISHQIHLLRLTAGEQKKLLPILIDLKQDLTAKLNNGLSQRGKAQVRKLLNQCNEVIAQYYGDIPKAIDYAGLAELEAQFTADTFAAIGLEASLPSQNTIKALVNGSLIQGAPTSAWWKRQGDNLAFKFSNQVRQGVAGGETIQQIVRRIAGSKKLGIPGIMETSRREAYTLVHSSIMQVSNDARRATFQENGDIIKGIRQLSTLDGHTSDICIAYSGAEFDLDGNPINGTMLSYEGGTPRHWRCRSIEVPITMTYKELGIDIPEVPKGTRASDLGQIDADTTFSGFLNRHSKEYQDKLLGAGRADLWRDGKITLSDLVNQHGRPLTLAELRRKL